MCPVMSGSDKIMSQCKSDRQLIRIFHVRLCVPKIIVHFFSLLITIRHIIVIAMLWHKMM